jgi:hypothetical protein
MTISDALTEPSGRAPSSPIRKMVSGQVSNLPTTDGRIDALKCGKRWRISWAFVAIPSMGEKDEVKGSAGTHVFEIHRGTAQKAASIVNHPLTRDTRNTRKG